MMSDDVDRSCVAFSADVLASYFCNITDNDK
jgi:hypothetical protein